jgi:hypothetical protein
MPRPKFTVEATVLVPTTDGRRLKIAAGVTGTFGLEGKAPYEVRPETSSILLALNVNTDRGQSFRATRLLTSSLLLDSWRQEEVGHLCRPDQVPQWPSPHAPLEKVRISWAQALLVVAAPQRENPGLWEPRLLDLSNRQTEAALHVVGDSIYTVLRLSDDANEPCALLRSRQIATMVLMPSLLGPHAQASVPTILVDTGEAEAPMPGVQLEP